MDLFSSVERTGDSVGNMAVPLLGLEVEDEELHSLSAKSGGFSASQLWEKQQ
jgi:hypothetical protein